MCGRFTQQYTWSELVELYTLTQTPLNLKPRYNIAPTTMIDVVRAHDGARELVSMRWGLIPAWWKKAIKDLPATFNARAETVADKPMFRSAFKRSRCIAPASGYYEWKTINGAKQPFYFSAADGGPLSIAGLWDSRNDPSGPAGPLLSCTLIVTAANEFASRIHDRMPVFLKPENFGAWLDGSAGPELLKPAGEGLLQVWPVSKHVNRPGNDGDVARQSG
jgi:putative SOS response-associated peptidase YedK